jgi:hypothetical protein
MTTPYNFYTQLEIGKQGEAFLDKFFGEYYIITPATDAEQAREIDRWFVDRGSGEQFSVEYKTDKAAGRWGNAFIELESNHQRGTQGWARMSEADRLIYYIPEPETIYMVLFADLREQLPHWEAQYKKKEIPNQTNKAYTTIGIAVPLHEFERCAVLVI